MQPRLNFINLAVNNLEQAIAFYRDGLGLPTRGIVGSEFRDEQTGAAGTIVFFELQGGLMLGLYERDNLAKDAAISLDATSSTEFSLGYAVKTKEEVDIVLKRAEAAGATITESVHQRPWGVYSGYFKDPDGHLWEITWDPRIEVGE
jgi:uncharacterized glyoxalase superfamily protein PhnB